MKKEGKMTKRKKLYLFRVIGRIVCFTIGTILILIEMFTNVNMNFEAVLDGWGFFKHLSPIHIVWILLAHYMIVDLFFTNLRHPGSAKHFGRLYIKKEYDKEELKKTRKFYNKGAWYTALSFTALNLVIGAATYLVRKSGFIAPVEKETSGLILLIFQLFYFASDFICVMFFCPFQSWMMRNRCCRTCRIFNWGAIMIEVPMIVHIILFGPSFYSVSLALLGLIVFLKWEITLIVHPERFFQMSNEYLSCKTCEDPFCSIKPKINSKYRNENKIL